MSDQPFSPPPELTADQLTALRNLARKQAGEDVDWINIAAAQMLTELGLAHRDRQGWRITPEGLQFLATQPHS